jgi:arylsulfatase A-like enzyme
MDRIFLIALDTLRADHLGAYGYVRNTSPRLDELASQGVLFEHCISQTGHTLPAFTTMATGQYPFTHGIVSTLYAHPDEPSQVVSDRVLTLPQLLREHKWTTAAFDNLGEFGCGPKWLTRGYDWYVSNVTYPGRVLCNVLAEDINARLLPWLRDHLADSLFLFVHYWDPHQPYNQPEPFWSMHVDGPAPEPITAPDGCAFYPTWGWSTRLADQRRTYLARYDGEISYVDHHLGALLDELKKHGAYDDAWIIVVADHGEDMEEHNAPFEHRETYDCNTRVPLIIKPPKGSAMAGKRVPALVGQLDLLPTILDLAGIDLPESADGTSLLPLMRGDVDSVRPHIFTHGGAVKQNGRWVSGEVAVRTPKWKYILRGNPVTEIGHGHLDVAVLSAPPFRGDRTRPPADWIHYFNRLQKQELYAVSDDPCEINEQFKQQSDKAAELRRLLVDYLHRRPDLFAGPPPA